MDQNLLNAFYLHRDALLAFLTKRTGEQQVALDVLQDLFLKIEALDGSSEIRYPKAYLYRIANNLVIDHQRQQAKFCKDDTLPEQVDDASPEQHLSHQQRLLIVSQAIDDLPDKTRKVFQMQRLQQRDKSEVASSLGISVNMVEKHLRKALQYCRDKLYKLEK